MGAFLDKPKTEKTTSSGEAGDIKYGHSSMQGWRVEMEDAHCIKLGLGEGLEDWSFFAVFDGHAGCSIAIKAADELLGYIIEDSSFASIKRKTKNLSSTASEHITNNLDVGSQDIIQMVKQAARNGFLNFDEITRKKDEYASLDDKSGTTAVCALISPEYVFLLNCGDSRGLICRGSRPYLATEDHKPSNPAERKRIENAGGTVVIQRVNGSLAVSRALGDYEYKRTEGKSSIEQLVSPDPDIYVHKRDSSDEYLVLACDGIWDVMSNDEIVGFLHHRLAVYPDLDVVCSELLDTCLHKGSRDNMTAILIAFPGVPSVDPAKVEIERQLDLYVYNYVRRTLPFTRRGDVEDVGYVMQQFSHQRDVVGLPPGGDIYAKQNLVEDILYNQISKPASPPPGFKTTRNVNNNTSADESSQSGMANTTNSCSFESNPVSSSATNNTNQCSSPSSSSDEDSDLMALD